MQPGIMEDHGPLMKIILFFVSLVITAVVLFYGLTCCENNLYDYKQLFIYLAKSNQMGDESYEIKLPTEFRNLSSDGYVYYTFKNKNKVLLFRKSIGRGGDFDGIIYSERELNVKDKLEIYTNLINRLGYMEVNVLRKLEGNWYSVTTGYLN